MNVDKIENWSLGYAMLKPYAQLVHWLTHKRIIIEGIENIPTDKPVIFAPNHQNALMDAMVLVTTIPGQIVFLARADIFKNKTVAKALRFLKIMPVYRIRDGKDSLDKNEEIFDHTIRILSNNKQIGLFPEAQHIGMKSMVAHKKAIPRIAFLAGEKTNYNLDIQIVPVGIYYSHYWKFQRTLVVSYGKPVAVQPFYEQLKTEGERAATIALRDRLYDELKELVVHVHDKENYARYMQLVNLFKPVVRSKNALNKIRKNEMRTEQQTLHKLEARFQADPPIRDLFFEAIDRVTRLQRRLRLSDKTLAQGPINPVGGILKLILLFCTLPIILAGAVTNGPVYWATRYPYRKGIKDPQFWSSVSFGISLFAYPIWLTILWVVLSVVLKSGLWALFAVVLSIPIGILAWHLGQQVVSTIGRLRFFFNKRKPQYEELQQKRMELIHQFQEF